MGTGIAAFTRLRWFMLSFNGLKAHFCGNIRGPRYSAATDDHQRGPGLHPTGSRLFRGRKRASGVAGSPLSRATKIVHSPQIDTTPSAGPTAPSPTAAARSSASPLPARLRRGDVTGAWLFGPDAHRARVRARIRRNGYSQKKHRWQPSGEDSGHVISTRRTDVSPAHPGETDLEMRSRTTLMVRSIGTKPVLSASATTIVARNTNALLGLNPRPVTSTAAIGM